MATNFAARRGKTGRLEGRREFFLAGTRFGPEASGDQMLVHTVLGVILNSPFNDYEESDLLKLRRPPNPVVMMAAESLVYKARPLNGIWATAPYLHNGSVPTLYDLLLPTAERPRQFTVGRREFDPQAVGFVTDPFPGGFVFRTVDEQGRAVPGNSNAGHEYGTGRLKSNGGDGLPLLTPEERWELVEYMKSL